MRGLAIVTTDNMRLLGASEKMRGLAIVTNDKMRGLAIVTSDKIRRLGLV